MPTYEVRTEPVRIDAPVGAVWSVLTAVDSYGEWNPFTPQARTDFAIGSPAHLLVRMGSSTFRITETVCAFEEPRLIAWEKSFGARWLLHAVRGQHLEPVGAASCSYRNTDGLTGLLAPIVWACFGGYMRRGFAAVGEALKAHVEAHHAGAGANG